jgi:GT2 family glycosyltransferase/Tfp pilus assembly protein PilF
MPLITPKEHAAGKPVKCSIIIPVYNGLDYTENCIESLLKDESKADFEIIVIDNGSTDDTPIYLASLDDRVKTISPGSNLGFSMANNLGAQKASGEYLILLNNDTIPEQGWLDALVSTADSDGKIGIVGAKLLYPIDRLVQHAGVVLTENLKLMHLYENFPEDHPAVNKRRDFKIVTAACMLVRRDAYLGTGCLNERFINGFEDVDFCLRVGESGYRVVYEPNATVLHHSEKTAGRHQYEDQNAILLTKLWRHKLTSDINKYLIEDNYKVKQIRGITVLIPRGEKMTERLDQARSALKEGNNEEALKIYQQLYNDDPQNPVILSYIVDIHERRGELEKAAATLLKLSRIEPSSKVFKRLSQNALKRQQYEQAQKYAREAVNSFSSFDDESAEARAILGDAAFKMGDVDSAGKMYDQILAAESKHVRALTGRGTVALMKQDYQTALNYFERALQVNPHHGRAVLGKGLSFINLSRRKEAADYILESLMIEPDNGWAIATVLPLLSEQGRLKEADYAIKIYLERYPDDYPMLLARAGVNFAMKSYNLSHELLDKVIMNHPDYPGVSDLERELNIMMAPVSEIAEAVPA